MLTKDIQFEFLGYRNYVHGSLMLKALLYACFDYWPHIVSQSVHIRQFKVIREFDTHGKVEVMASEKAQGLPRLRDAVARLDIETPSGRMTSLLYDKKGHPVTYRWDSYESGDYVESVNAREDGTASGLLKNLKNMIDLIRGVIEANKQLTLGDEVLTASMKKMRWVYLKDFHVLLPSQVPGTIEVIFDPISIVELPHRIFTEKKFHLKGFDQFTAAMGFYIEL